MTLYEIIRLIAQHSESVFIYDFNYFSKDKDFYKLYKGVKELHNITELDESDLTLLNKEIVFQELELSEKTVTLYLEKEQCFGLTCKHNGYLLYQDILDSVEYYSAEHLSEIVDSIPFEKRCGLTEKEYDIVLTIVHRILSSFETFKLCDLIFLQYLCKCINDKNFYCKKSLDSMFLINFSEVPNFKEALKYVRMKNNVKEKALVLRKRNIRLSDAFISFYSSETIKKFIYEKFSMSVPEVEALIQDMELILKCFEVGNFE